MLNNNKKSKSKSISRCIKQKHENVFLQNNQWIFSSFCSLPLSIVQCPLQKTPVWRDWSHHHEPAGSKNLPVTVESAHLRMFVPGISLSVECHFAARWFCLLIDCVITTPVSCLSCFSNHSLLLLCVAVGLPELPVHTASGERSGGGHGSEEDEHQDPQQSLQWGEWSD